MAADYQLIGAGEITPALSVGGQLAAPTAENGFGSGRWAATGTVALTKPITDNFGAFVHADFTKYFGTTKEVVLADWATGFGGGVFANITERLQMRAALGDTISAHKQITKDGPSSSRHNLSASVSGLIFDKGIPYLELSVGVDQLQSRRLGVYASIRAVAVSF